MVCCEKTEQGGLLAYTEPLGQGQEILWQLEEDESGPLARKCELCFFAAHPSSAAHLIRWSSLCQCPTWLLGWFLIPWCRDFRGLNMAQFIHPSLSLDYCIILPTTALAMRPHSIGLSEENSCQYWIRLAMLLFYRGPARIVLCNYFEHVLISIWTGCVPVLLMWNM